MTHSEQSSTRNRTALVLLSLALVAVILGGAWALKVALTAPVGQGTESQQASHHSPESVHLALDAAREYIHSNQAGSAVAVLQAAAEKWPEEQSIRLLYGEALLSMGRGQDAYGQYDLAIQIGPDNPEYRHVAGTIATGIGRLNEAEMHYLAAQQMDPKNPKYPLYLAQVQRQQGMIEEARASLVLAANLDPTLGIAWASLAAIALDENRASVALGYIKRAREVEPQRLEWRVIEARALLRNHNPQQAAELLMAVPEVERLMDPAALRELGSALALLDRTSEAAAMYVKAVSLRPDDPELAYETALWLERDGQKSRAATFASHAAAKGFGPARALAERLDAE